MRTCRFEAAISFRAGRRSVPIDRSTARRPRPRTPDACGRVAGPASLREGVARPAAGKSTVLRPGTPTCRPGTRRQGIGWCVCADIVSTPLPRLTSDLVEHGIHDVQCRMPRLPCSFFMRRTCVLNSQFLRILLHVCRCLSAPTRGLEACSHL